MPAGLPSRFAAPSLGFKLGFAFLLLALLTAGLSALVIVNLVRVRRDARQFMEETREARLAHGLLTAVEALQEPALLPSRRALLLDRAGGFLDGLEHGPGRSDPSTPDHQSAERRITSELREALRRLGGFAVVDADDDENGEAAALARIARLAGAVRDETDAEASRASRDLERRVRGLAWLMLGAGAAAVTILLLLFSYVHHGVVRPLRRLRHGARQLARGLLGHRIPVESEDEVGELAGEFNRMADSLTRTHRELEERVEERTRQFVRAARLADLGTFAAGIAHEVNTPLATIASCAEGLERRLAEGRDDPAVVRDYLETISGEAYRARAITDRLLDFARREPGPLAAVEPGEVVEEVARLFRHQAGKAGVGLAVDADPDPPPVRANRAELQQVLLNLVKNAVDASPADAEVHLACRTLPEGVELTVSDRGEGIPPEHLKRIFDPFFTTKEPGAGTGLGLSLAHRVVESYGGTIEAQGRAGGGTRLRILLPAAAEEASA